MKDSLVLRFEILLVWNVCKLTLSATSVTNMLFSPSVKELQRSCRD